MPAAGTPVAYLGIDVGKSSHSACALDAGGGIAFRAELANRPDDIDRLLERAGSGALVVVDQKRNIGALVLARAHVHGNPCAYLPGYAEKQARGMFPGIAKTDAIDAVGIALHVGQAVLHAGRGAVGEQRRRLDDVGNELARLGDGGEAALLQAGVQVTDILARGAEHHRPFHLEEA